MCIFILTYYYCTCIIPLFGIVTNYKYFILIVCKGQASTSIYSFFVIVKLPDDGHNIQLKHMVQNKWTYKYSSCCVIRKEKTDNNFTNTTEWYYQTITQILSRSVHFILYIMCCCTGLYISEQGSVVLSHVFSRLCFQLLCSVLQVIFVIFQHMFQKM